MKKILLLCFVTSGAFLFSQERNIQIISDGFIISLENEEPIHVQNKKGEFDIIDYFQFTDASIPGSYKLPSKSILIAIPPYTNPEISLLSFNESILSKSIPRLNPSLVTLNDSTVIESYNDLQYKPSKNSNKNSLEIVGYGWFREFYCVQVKIYTHYFNEIDNSIREIEDIRLKVKFNGNINYDFTNESEADELTRNVIYNHEISNQLRSNPVFNLQDTTGSWIDFTAEYLKIGTASDELFRVTKSDLESRGVNTSTINPRTFQLFQSGKEVEIIVSGEQDSVLNDDDYILFFGKRNYSRKDHRVINNPDQEYNEYLNRYTDTTFYFLTWGATYGKRIQNLNTASSTSDTLNYYKHFEHIEDNRVHFNAYNNEVENQFPNYNRNKSWYSSQTVWLYSGTTRNFSFNTSDLIQNKIAKFYFKGVSGGSNVTLNAHNISLRVNGELLDSVILDRYKQVLLQGSLITSQLLPTNNTLSVKNYINGTNPNFVVIDWYEIEYPSLLKLNNDVLIFEVYEDVNEAVRVIKIENAFVNDYIILKLSPVMKHFTNYQISNNSLTFIDTVKAGDKYLVADSANVQKPIFYYKKQFVNLRSVTQQKDYLAITHPKFLQGSQNYLTSIQSFYNVSTDLINVQDVFDEFSYGYKVPEAIRLYLSVTFQNRISPKPSYITLIGDANYDYKDYIFKATGVKGGGNYVPSYGIPVSDNWFVVWNDSSVLLPQMKLGRIPVNEVSELDYYLAKIENNESKPFDEWNKRYLFFSGGINDSEIEFLKAANDDIIYQWISPRPVSGNYTHFYKTVSPRTDFGPYTPDEIEAAISSGSLFISYIGHSGTATWDNSINATNQLYNEVDRNPLITDFGCSTNKYAEPDIICFGERFLFNSTGQALAYVGNSSLGFSSTAVTASKYFYEHLVADSISEIGNAHLFSKIKLFNQQGNSSVNRVFSLSNVILGDPAVRIKIPKLPNFKISSSDIILSGQIITDNLDSTEIKIALNNLGLAEAGMLDLSIVHLFNSEEIDNILLTVPVPSYSDTIIIWISTQNKPGIHILDIDIDPDDQISEIYEDDNSLNYQFNVFSNSLRDFLTSRIENSSIQSLNILNPATFNSETFSVEFQVASDDSFSNPTTIISEADTFTTKIDLPILSTDERYFFRYRINSTELSFSGVKSFYNNYSTKFLLIDSLAFANQNSNNLTWENESIKIVLDSTNISVLSSGFYSGATCVIAKDGVNLLSNTFFAGMGIAVFDNISLEVDTVTWFQLFNQPANVEALASFIDSIPAGKIVVMGVADDARNNLSTHLKDAIKSLGSLMIDSLEFRGSWALIGWKGAPIGSVIEEVQPALPPQSIFLDTSFVFQGTSGFFSTDEIGPASYWKEIQIDEELLGDASSQYILHGKRLNGQIDSIRTLDFDNGMVDIRDIDADQYPHIILQGNFEASSDNESPILKRLSLDFNSVPELGTNYQVVSSTADTILIGEDVGLNFYVYNVGEVTADTFKIKVDVINDDNTHNTVFETMVDSIQSGVRKYYEVIHNTSAGTGDKTFLIDIDSDQEVTELFEDNNFYRVPFYVKQDTSKPTLTIAFDGVDILDGDYISPNPEIKIELSDQSLLPVTDTSAVKILLNNEPVYYADNQSTMSAEFNAENPKVVVTYKPELSDGEYLLKVFGQNSLGSMVDSAGVEKHFVVSNEVKLLNVYNYPNPTSGETYFTFKLTQIPDELKIKIYTIAGRLIKELSVPASDLSFDFNKIYWNGKDEDGDDLANGVYLYKMIIKAGDKTEDVIQKLAIVR